MGKNTYVESDKAISFSDIPVDKLNLLLADPGLNALKTALNDLSAKYKINQGTIAFLAQKEKKISIPTSIFCDKKLSALELSVKYLKEELSLKFSQIAALLNRDERTIWATYHNSRKKSKQKSIVKEGYFIPIDVLSDRKYSILEKAVGYLKEEENLRFSDVAKILCRDDRTIWTCYSRLKSKREDKNEAR